MKKKWTDLNACSLMKEVICSQSNFTFAFQPVVHMNGLGKSVIWTGSLSVRYLVLLYSFCHLKETYNNVFFKQTTLQQFLWNLFGFWFNSLQWSSTMHKQCVQTFDFIQFDTFCIHSVSFHTLPCLIKVTWKGILQS